MNESLTEDPEDHLPSPQARPEQIRPYLAHILITHGMPESQAVQLASRWTVGTGQDLRSCPLDTLSDTFGELAGWILHNSVRARASREEKGSSQAAGWSPKVKCTLPPQTDLSSVPLLQLHAYLLHPRRTDRAVAVIAIAEVVVAQWVFGSKHEWIVGPMLVVCTVTMLGFIFSASRQDALELETHRSFCC